jgi:hypothetical protein
MPKRFIGDAVVEIRYIGHIAGRDEYVGNVRAGCCVWKFDSLYAPSAGFSFGYDSPQAYDHMAEAAISFGAYYTSRNRGDDVPSWAPPPELADIIDEATLHALCETGDYRVSRTPNKVR